MVFRGPDPQPFTLALFDLGKMNDLLVAASNLADELVQVLPNQRDLVVAAAAKTTRYESNYDGALDTMDTYADLNAFSQQILDHFSPGSGVGKAAAAVKNEIALAVVSSDFDRGSPWKFPKRTWGLAQILAAWASTCRCRRMKKPSARSIRPQISVGLQMGTGTSSWLRSGRANRQAQNLPLRQPCPRCVSTTTCASLLASPLNPVDDTLYLPVILDN